MSITQKNKKQKGFTLIELLVVIAIIGLLTTVAMVAMKNAREKSRDTKRKGDLRQLYTALNVSFNSAGNGLYPVQATFACIGQTTTPNLYSALVTNNIMKTLPNDPMGGAWCYQYRGGAQDFKIIAKLENDTTLMANDGGPSGAPMNAFYEIFTPGAQSWQ
jgi:type II secretion system protein G